LVSTFLIKVFKNTFCIVLLLRLPTYRAYLLAQISPASKLFLHGAFPIIDNMLLKRFTICPPFIRFEPNCVAGGPGNFYLNIWLLEM
jgi:hypothetical protein